MNNHPFHLVNKSPWPLLSALSLFSLMSGMIKMFYNLEYDLMIMGVITTTLIMTMWWRDVIRESTFQGLHTKKVTKSMKLGMMLFIVSEVMFFMSFFWAFFHSSLAPAVEIGMKWPPSNIKTFNPMSIPLLNTIILISSGITMTWAHSAIIKNNQSQSYKSMVITIMLGIYFTLLQAYEYNEASFCMSDSIYGSTFFMSTGFHGIHVMIGTMLIMITMKRLKNLHFSNHHHVGFESASWYWHFVDVVWLFLYMSIYWWGS